MAAAIYASSSAAMTLRVLQVLHQGGGAGSVTSTLHLCAWAWPAPGWRSGSCVRRAPRSRRSPGKADSRSSPSRCGRASAARTRPRSPRCSTEARSTSSTRRARATAQALTWLGLSGRLRPPLVLTRRQMPRTFFFENWLAVPRGGARDRREHGRRDALERKGTPARKLAVIPNGLVSERVDCAGGAAALAGWRARIGLDGRRNGPSASWLGRRTRRSCSRPWRPSGHPVRLVLAGVEPGSSRWRDAARRGAVAPCRRCCLSVHRGRPPALRAARPGAAALAHRGALPVAARGDGAREAGHRLGGGGNLDLSSPAPTGCSSRRSMRRAWAAAIDRLLGDTAAGQPAGHGCRAGRRGDTFALDRTIERTLAVYERLLSDPLAPRARPG